MAVNQESEDDKKIPRPAPSVLCADSECLRPGDGKSGGICPGMVRTAQCPII